MEVITSQLEILQWMFSPAGLVITLVIVGLLLSGLPGLVFPNVEATASDRRFDRRRMLVDQRRPRERIRG